jgi:MFS family permease
VWHILLLSILFGFISAFFQPAYAAMVPEITPTLLLPSANSLTSLSGQASMILGPMIGAFIIKVGGTPLAFLLNGFSFLAAVLLLVPIMGIVPQVSKSTPQNGEARHSIMHDLREGLGLVAGSPWLWITILIFSLINVTLSGPLNISLPFLIDKSFNGDVNFLGIVYALQGVGAILGSLWLGNVAKIRRRGLLAYGGTFLAGASLAVMGLPVHGIIIGLGALMIGVGMTVFSLIWTNTLQELVPLEKLGRVVSIDQLGSFALLPIGYGIAGKLTNDWGPSTVFLVGGIGTMLMLATGLLHPAVRNLD